MGEGSLGSWRAQPGLKPPLVPEQGPPHPPLPHLLLVLLPALLQSSWGEGSVETLPPWAT